MSRSGSQLAAALVAGVLAAVAGTAVHLTGLLSALEQDAVQLRFRLRPAAPPPEVVVVAIDEATFSDLRRRWPFPRSLHARVIDRLRTAGAKAVVYDVQFTEPTTRREDLSLYRAVARARSVVLATSETDERGRSNVLGGDANLARAHARAAASNLPTQSGGVFQRFTATAGGLPTLAVAAVEVADRRRLAPASFEPEGAWIDYRGPPGTVPRISFSDVLRGRFDRQRLRGRIVVVGATAPTLQDVHPTPTSARELMSGAEIQANAIWTALHRLPLRSAPHWLNLLAVVLLAVAPCLAGLRLRPPAVALLAPVLGAGWLGAAALAFGSGVVVAVAPPLAALAAGTVGMVAASYAAERRERQRVAHYNELLELRVLERTEELRETQLDVVRRLGQAAESRDEQTGEHIERMSALCHRLGVAAGMAPAEADLLRHASAMHDVGKIGIPDSVLLKPGKLDAREREVMQSHTTIGASLLAGSRSPLLQMAEVIARTHHERWDGTGYPAGLRGEEIPLVGRICAIADVFNALVSARSYKQAWPVEAALAEIADQAGRHFDPRLVEIFLTAWSEPGGEHADRPRSAPVAASSAVAAHEGGTDPRVAGSAPGRRTTKRAPGCASSSATLPP